MLHETAIILTAFVYLGVLLAHFIGVPVGVKVGGGSVDTIKNYVRVSCAPSDVPESFEIDITDLDIGKGVHVSEINYPEGVKPVTETTALVVTILKK